MAVGGGGLGDVEANEGGVGGGRAVSDVALAAKEALAVIATMAMVLTMGVESVKTVKGLRRW